MKKRGQSGNVALLVITGAIILTILTWLIYSMFILKDSAKFCEVKKYVWLNYSKKIGLFENFDNNLCKEDCVEFCSDKGYEYKRHYQSICENPKTYYACSCKCK